MIRGWRTDEPCRNRGHFWRRGAAHIQEHAQLPSRPVRPEQGSRHSHRSEAARCGHSEAKPIRSGAGGTDLLLPVKRSASCRRPSLRQGASAIEVVLVST